MNRIACTFEAVEEPSEVGFKSTLLNNCISALPKIREEVTGFLNVFNHAAASKDDKYDFFKDSDDEEYEAINEHKLVCFSFDLGGVSDHFSRVLLLLKPIFKSIRMR